jgi:hypothetical protein
LETDGDVIGAVTRLREQDREWYRQSCYKAVQTGGDFVENYDMGVKPSLSKTHFFFVNLETNIYQEKN